jgi:hypothetical protein
LKGIDLSILIISCNTCDLTLACLRSLLESSCDLQTEIFVVDNASTDGSVEAIVGEFPQVRVIANRQNRGFAAANNQALQLAAGRCILLLNSDTVVLGDVLSRSVQYLDANPDVGAMGCRVLNPDRSLQPTCFQFPTLLNLSLLVSGLDRLPRPKFLGRFHMRGWARDHERDVEVVTGCYLMVRRAAIERVGHLDESFFFCGEETDWCRRFKADGWKVRFAPVGEIIHVGNASGRQHGFRRDLMLSQGMVRLHQKHTGMLAAMVAWILLLGFNASRAFYWLLYGLVSNGELAMQRRQIYAATTLNFADAWPRARGARA